MTIEYCTCQNNAGRIYWKLRCMKLNSLKTIILHDCFKYYEYLSYINTLQYCYWDSKCRTIFKSDNTIWNVNCQKRLWKYLILQTKRQWKYWLCVARIFNKRQRVAGESGTIDKLRTCVFTDCHNSFNKMFTK
jgi:hypothetical protein